jgi:DNA replication and repair protein RecF
MIRFGETEGAIEANLQKEEGSEKVRLEMRSGKNKTLFLDGKKQKKLSSLLGKIPAVVFSPDDLFLVKGSPGLRRRYLDLTILQMDRGYLAHYQQFERTLKQRNSLLRQKGPGVEAQLPVWDAALSGHGAALMEKRGEIAGKLSELARKALQDLTGGLEDFEVRYEPSLPLEGPGSLEARMEKALKEARREEISRGLTVLGPHRDDLGLFVNGKLLRKFGSQGQQRTGALALKLAQLSLLAEGCGTAPMVLFDDVMAELDRKRRAFFLDRLRQGGQAFLTGTSMGDFSAAAAGARVFTVEAGRIRTEQPGPGVPSRP